ncbi:hypothetical protein DPEC_G00114780 [Dallia pectoralis]|uniref:Uncharacterized protein n=1 Tax=Dallia pectoralis TaxID=75939 RepID=A0ACC2GU63_DALPE|nr:hypothetical protein DPEC_G00114780 [Dallia pectoralis]
MGIALTIQAASTLIEIENKMVEHGRVPSRVMSLRAGPEEMDITLSNQNPRIHTRAVQTIGRQLAEIGDRMARERAERRPVAGPMRALTRNVYRRIQGHLCGLKSLSVVARARLASTVHRQATHRAEAWAAWVSSIQPAISSVWAKTMLATVALVAVTIVCSELWEEWIGKMLH